MKVLFIFPFYSDVYPHFTLRVHLWCLWNTYSFSSMKLIFHSIFRFYPWCPWHISFFSLVESISLCLLGPSLAPIVHLCLPQQRIFFLPSRYFLLSYLQGPTSVPMAHLLSTKYFSSLSRASSLFSSGSILNSQCNIFLLLPNGA